MPNEKDSTEKHLLNYADVFADVVNVLVFHGKEVIDPKDLVSTEARSVLTLHGKTREQERDVVKIWTKGNTKIALVGLENQTLQDKDMPLRVLAYDGASYKEQVNHHRSKNKELKEEKTYPCLSFVLYFGKHIGQSQRVCWNVSKTFPKNSNPLSMIITSKYSRLHFSTMIRESFSKVIFVMSSIICIKSGPKKNIKHLHNR